jgi:hypothetical protein
LKAFGGHRERRADDDGEENAREANLDDDHAVIAGERLSLVEQDADQVASEAVEGNGNGSEFERYHYDDKKDDGQKATLKEEALQRQWAHACSWGTALLKGSAKNELRSDVLDAGGFA